MEASFWELKPGPVVLLTVGKSSRRDFSPQSKFRHLACLRFVNQPFRRLDSVPDVSQSFIVESCSTTDVEQRVFLWYMYIFISMAAPLFVLLLTFSHLTSRLSLLTFRLRHLHMRWPPPPLPVPHPHMTTSPLFIGRRFWSSKRLLTLLRTPSARL